MLIIMCLLSLFYSFDMESAVLSPTTITIWELTSRLDRTTNQIESDLETLALSFNDALAEFDMRSTKTCSKIGLIEQEIQESNSLATSKSDNFSADIATSNEEICSELESLQAFIDSSSQQLHSCVAIVDETVQNTQEQLCSKIEGIVNVYNNFQESGCDQLQLVEQRLLSAVEVVDSLKNRSESLIENVETIVCSKFDELSTAVFSISDDSIQTIGMMEQVISSVGDILHTTISLSDQEVQDIRDTLCSKLDLLDTTLTSLNDKVCDTTQNIQQDIVSVSDEFSSSFEVIESEACNNQTVICSKLEALKESLESINDSITLDSLQARQAGSSLVDTFSNAVNRFDSDGVSTTDLLCSKLEDVQAGLNLLNTSTIDDVNELSGSIASVCDLVLDTVIQVNSIADDVSETLSVLESMTTVIKDEVIASICDKVDVIDVFFDSLSDGITASFQESVLCASSFSDNVCTKLAIIAADTNSVTDLFSSQLMGVEDTTNSLLDLVCDKLQRTESNLISSSDVFTTEFSTIIGQTESVFDDLCTKLVNFDRDLCSISDEIVNTLENGDSVIFSVSDVLCDKIIGINENLLSVSDLLVEGSGASCLTLESQLDAHDMRVCSLLDFTQEQAITAGIDTSALDSLVECSYGTLIAQSDIPFTISTPGNYRLCEDVTNTTTSPAISITSGAVVFDLGGHTLSQTTNNTAIDITTSGQNITVRNGSIDSFGFGIFRDGNFVSRFSFFENLKIRSDGIGIYIEDARRDTIRNCYIASFRLVPQSLASGIRVINSPGLNIQDCIVENAVRSGYNIDSNLAYIRNCKALKEIPAIGASGFRFAEPRIVVKDCIAEGFEVGFLCLGNTGASVVFQSCIAKNCSALGFRLDNSVARDCCAVSCGNGSLFSGGFLCAIDNILENCIADQSVGNGFSHATNVSEVFYKNCIARNSTVHGFLLRAGTASLRECLATDNGTNGFDISVGASIVLKDCVATENGASGIDDNGIAATILDTRSANNGAADVLGASTVITY